jgi:integrase
VHRLALLWLDWSGARVASVDKTRIGDYDEARRRVRLSASASKSRRALWVELPEALADAIESRLPPREDRDPEARLFPGSGSDALRTSIAKACRALAIPLWSPHDLRHRRISLLHQQGCWPRCWPRRVESVDFQHALIPGGPNETRVTMREPRMATSVACVMGEGKARGARAPVPPRGSDIDGIVGSR